MPKLPRLPKPPQSDDDDQLSDARPAYEVGYRRPPVHTRFKAGQSGNPKGRPRQQRNVRTVVEEALNQRITIREGHQTRSVTKLTGTILSIVNAALKGDAKAQSILFTLIRSLGMIEEPSEATNQESLTPDDQAVIADYFQRNRCELQQLNKPARNKACRTRAKTPPDTKI